VNITVPTNIPSGDRRTVRVALPPVPVALVLVDRDGDVWRQVGTNYSGEPLMLCDLPRADSDRGSGRSFPWTQQMVEDAFSPVRTLGGAA
jgi:hypothetical protein